MPRVLVIETEVRLRHAFKTILESAGYDVELANDRLDGLRRHATHPADLIIADHMDEEMDGFIDAPILGVPSAASQRSESWGTHNLLPKPFRRDDLLAAVQATLAMRAQVAASAMEARV